MNNLYFEELETADEMITFWEGVGLAAAGAAGVGVGYYVCSIVAAAVAT